MASNSAITARQRGSYDPVVTLSDGSRKFLSDLMVEIYNSDTTVSGVKENLTVSYTRTVTNATDAYLYAPDSTPDALLAIPSLEELGFTGSGWRMDVVAFASMRTDTAPQSVEVRLVDVAGNAIAGSTGTGSVSSTTADTLVKTTKATITGPGQVALDFRRTAGAGEAQLYHVTLLVQVVRI